MGKARIKSQTTLRQIIYCTILPALFVIMLTLMQISYGTEVFGMSSDDEKMVWIHFRNFFNLIVVLAYIGLNAKALVQKVSGGESMSFFKILIHTFIALTLINYSYKIIELFI